jgi:hypothetical protein
VTPHIVKLFYGVVTLFSAIDVKLIMMMSKMNLMLYLPIRILYKKCTLWLKIMDVSRKCNITFDTKYFSIDTLANIANVGMFFFTIRHTQYCTIQIFLLLKFGANFLASVK